MSLFHIAEDILFHCLDSWSVNGRKLYKCVCEYVYIEMEFPMIRVYNVWHFSFPYRKLDSGEKIQEGNLNNQVNWKATHTQQNWEKMGSKGHVFLPELLLLKAILRKGIYSNTFFQFFISSFILFYFLGNNFIFQYYFTCIVKSLRFTPTVWTSLLMFW